MSNAEARPARTFPPPGGEHLGLGGGAQRRSAGTGIGRRRLFAAATLSGDIVSGSLAIVAAAVIIAVVWPTGQIALADWLRTQLAVLLLLLLGINCALGLYRPYFKNKMERFRLRATATLLFIFAGMLMWIRVGPSVALAIIPTVGAIALVLGLWIEHLIGTLLVRLDVHRVPTAILGTGANSRALAGLLLTHPNCGLRPVGLVDGRACSGDGSDRFARGRETDGAPGAALPVFNTLEEWRADGGAEVVVVPDCELLPDDPAALYRLDVRQILVVNRLGGFPTFGLQVRNTDCFVAVELNGRPRGPGEGQKRAIDLVVSLVLLLLTAPIMGLLALAIKFTDPGPAFYGQWRVGRHGKPIRVLKLRTMYRDAEQRLERVLESDPGLREHWLRYFKLPRDPRILPRVGELMRRASLDELPQLWNVLRGDMSLVGPRPFPAYHLDAFDPEFRALRATVPPGLTGLWQISSRSDGDLDLQRAEDCFYIKNRSLWLDLYILFATPPAVLRALGAR